MKLRPLALLLAPLAACSDEPPPEPVSVMIRTVEPPALVAVRDQASSEWRALPIAGASTFQVDLRGRYEVIIVCENAGTFSPVVAHQHARTPADEPLVRTHCFRNNARAFAGPFVVRGTMVQRGMLALDTSSDDVFSPNGSFELSSDSAGSFDLLMFSENASSRYDRLAIRRDLAITGDTDLGSIDLEQEGVQPLIRTPISATNLEPGERLGATVHFQTSSSGLGLGQGDGDMLLAPASLLRATDKQWADISAHQFSYGEILRSRSRTVTREVRAGESPSVTFPAPLGPVTFDMTADRLIVRWSEVPVYDGLWLSHYSASSDRALSHDLFLSASFLDATDATSGVLDFRGVPGFKSEWRHDPADKWDLSLQSSRFTSEYDAESWMVAEWTE